MEQLLPYALTTPKRVKALMAEWNVNFDKVITREINSVSEFLQKQCNRNFLYQKYISDVKTQWGSRQQYIILKEMPIFWMTDTVAVNAGSLSVTLNNINGVQVGMPIAGDGINSGTYISGVNTGTKVITLSQYPFATNAAADIFINGLVSLKYRAGTPDNPQWTAFLPPQFEVVAPGDSGIVRVYGYVSTIYNNTIKATYWAGFLINWLNAGDDLTHTLPADLSRTAENLVIRGFKRREFAGKNSQSLEQSNVSYRNLLDDQDLQVINSYKVMPSQGM